ncbi:LacI family DNA-binding transcriptional regulator [Jiangella anatolica]|uniref:LacI family DNA-binding transcriptional regulator n=1 Tax=Jiangella anatolica TaxID=2670374 RepID=UPI001314F7E7|nr:LacI family DNA-binding transcriptional regulator [Jiangella anatolica]
MTTETPSSEPRRSRRPSMRIVAERAGVAVSSVSRVLSGHEDVSSVMRNRVLDAVAAIGYERDLLAQSLRTGATYSVGFVAIDVANPVIALNAAGAESLFRDAGYGLLISSSGGDPDLDLHYLRHFEQRRVDGMILSLAHENNPDTLALLRQLSTPLALIDRTLPREIPASAVLHDHATGIDAAVADLAGRGHTRFALVNGAPHVRPSKERARALRRAVRAAGGEPVTVKARAYSAEHGYTTTMSFLAARPRPTVLFVGGNQILAGALRALAEEGVRIPEDMEVVTFDKVALSDFLRPPLGFVTRDPRGAGRLAAELLLEQFDGAEPRTVTVPTAYEPAPR